MRNRKQMHFLAKRKKTRVVYLKFEDHPEDHVGKG